MAGLRIRIILVRGLYETNVGASSRAMANMGATDLILIAPECEIGYAARQSAATGQFALQNRRTYKTWEEFYAAEPQGIRLGLTARDGRNRDVRDLHETLDWLKTESPQMQALRDSDSESLILDLIFGPENWGLSNEDLDQAHYAVTIPTYGDNTSLNLAQCVLLALFMVRQALPEFSTVTDINPSGRPDLTATPLPEKVLKDWFISLGFELDDRGVNVFTVIRRLFQHSVPTEKELGALQVVLQQSIRKMNEYNEMRKKLGLS